MLCLVSVLRQQGKSRIGKTGGAGIGGKWGVERRDNVFFFEAPVDTSSSEHLANSGEMMEKAKETKSKCQG